MTKSLFFNLILISLIFSSFTSWSNSVSYTSGLTFYNGTAITPLSPTTSGSTPTSYSVSPTLIAGLTLNTATGVISGTPTANTYYSSYTITANFSSGGSATFNLGLYVDGIVYSYPSYSFYQGTAIKDPQNNGTALNPTVYGTGTSYSISPVLPTGLTFNTSSGVISGTPTAVSSSTSYTITATFAGGTSSTAMTISVAAPTLVYSSSSYIFYKGAAISMPVPTASGSPASFSINPTTITSNGSDYLGYQGNVIGTPTVSQATIPYTFTANYVSGITATANVNITIDGIAYAGTPYSFQDGAAISPISPTTTGETPTSYSISPTLPTGLSLNTTTGVITGTPTTVTSQTTYSVTANYSGGSTTTPVQITTTVAYLTYTTPHTYVPGVAITALSPTVTNDPVYDTPSYTVSPALPAGLTLSSSGVISGTPTGSASNGNYAVTGIFNYGNAKATFVINIIIDGASYAGSPYTFYKGTSTISATPTVAGSPTLYAISPSLPAGLSMSTSTGIISGTPTALSSAANYTVTITFGTSGSTTTTVNLQVLAPPTISYSGSPYTDYVGTTITSLTPTTTGTPSSYSISPNLTTNTGLSFNTSTGVISGAPTTASTSTAYTVTAIYGGGIPSATTTVNFTVKGISGLSYTGTPFTYNTSVTAITAVSPTITGTPTSYTISPSLTAATGLTFNTTTGVISGTASIVSTATTYTINAIYGGATVATTTISVTVNGFNYPGSPFSILPSANFDATPTTSYSGNSTTYTSSPALPSNFSFNNSNKGEILSTAPNTLQSPTTYTITASTGASNTIVIGVSNTGGSGAVLSYTVPATIYTGCSVSLSPTVTISPSTYSTPFKISPALPGNLSIDPNTGIISGYPTATQTSTTYTITYQWANGTPNKTTTTISFAVAAPSVSYTGSPFTYYTGTAITSLTPGGNGTPSSYAISTSLPAGLSFNTTTGVISGTPTATSSAVTYTVTPNYNGVTITPTPKATIVIGVNGLSYSSSTLTYVVGTAITTLTPTVAGTVTGYTIGPSLTSATGLTFNTSNGTISGTPTTASAAANYTITATFSGGVTATATINVSGSVTSYTWTGNGVNTNWDNAANWSTGVAPTATTGAIIPNTTNSPTVNVPLTCYSITVTGNTTLTLSAPLTVTAGLTLNGGNLTFAGTSTASFGGASTFGSANTLTIGSTNTVTFNSTTLNLANGNGINSTVAIANAGTLNLNSTTLTEGTSLTINNTGALNLNGSTVVLGNAVTSFTSPAYSTNLTTGGDSYSLKNSGTITANNGSVFTLNDVGTIYNSSTFIGGSSNSSCTFNLSGNGTTIINAGTFLVGSTSVINLTGGTYSYSGGTVTPSVTNNSGHNFALMSDANGSATIGQITNGGVFTGNFYVQRYVPAASGGGYRLLSSPVFGGTSTSPAANYADLTYLNTTTPAINGTTYPGVATGGPGGALSGFTITNNNPTMFLYDEAIIPPSTSQVTFFTGKNVGLTQISSTGVQYKNTRLTPSTGTTPVYAGTGFSFYNIGPSSSYATHGAINATTISYNGQINQNNIPFYSWFAPTGKLSYTTGTGTTYVGYNLVGNPYASTIDLNKLASDNFASGTVTFYELTDAQTFCSWTYNVGTGIGTSDGTSVRYIASGQGFYILATGTTQTLTFKEDQKVNSTVPSGFMAMPNGQTINGPNTLASTNRSLAQSSQLGYTGLHLMIAKDSSIFKTCGIFFNDSWNDELDDNDAKDLDGISPQIYLSSYTSDGTRTSINAMANYNKGKNVKLYVKSTTDGAYKINLMNVANIDTANFDIHLVDNYKKDTVNIGQNKTYSFNIANADTTTFGGNRFVLSIVPKITTSPYKLLAFNGVKNRTNVAVTWKTTNEGNLTTFGVQKYDAKSKKFKTIDSLESNGSGTYNYVDQTPVKGNNTYRLVQTNLDGATTYSNALIINYGVSGLLTVYPNPAVNVVTVNLTDVTSSITETYNISIYNSMGVKVMQKSVSGDAASQDVSALKPGIYIVDVKTKYGNSIGNAKFLKH